MKRRREASPDLFSLRCETCNRYLVRTESGYMACDRGHGKLLIEAPEIPEADTYSMFIDDLEPVDGSL